MKNKTKRSTALLLGTMLLMGTSSIASANRLFDYTIRYGEEDKQDRVDYAYCGGHVMVSNSVMQNCQPLESNVQACVDRLYQDSFRTSVSIADVQSNCSQEIAQAYPSPGQDQEREVATPVSELNPQPVVTIEEGEIEATLQASAQNALTQLSTPTSSSSPNPNPELENASLDQISCTGELLPEANKRPETTSPVDIQFTNLKSNISASGEKTLAEQGDKADGFFFHSDLLVTCENQGTKPWSEFSDKLSTSTPDVWNPSWNYFLKNMIGLQDEFGNTSRGNIYQGIAFDAKEIAYINDCSKTGNLTIALNVDHPKVKILKGKMVSVAKKAVVLMGEHRMLLEKCEALAHITTEADYDADYPTSGRSAKTIKKSFDQKITCEAYGAETQDYKACTNFINVYDASFVAKGAMGMTQQLHYQGQTMDRQSEIARQTQTGGLDHRGALGAQKDDIKDRANYATQTAALDSAKLATLFGILQSMPTRASLKEACGASLSTKADAVAGRLNAVHQKMYDDLGKDLASMGLTTEDIHDDSHISYIPRATGFAYAKRDGTGDNTGNQNATTAYGDAGDLCSLVADARTRAGRRGNSEGSADTSSLIINQEMRSVAKQILATTAVEAAASFAAAGMLNSQAKKIDDLLKRIEGYDPSDDFVAPSAELMAGPCAFDPTQPGCNGAFSGNPRAVGFGNTSLSFSGGGFGSSGTMLSADEGYDNATGTTTGNSDRSGASQTVGAVIPGGSKQSGLIDSPQGAASVKTSAAGRSGGGGGGASAVGSTGGGGGGGSGQQARGGQANGGKQIAYAGSSIGRLSGGRGVSRKPASAKDNGANPFANMFKKGGPNNATLNFRGPAGIGGKSGNIFDQISSRYQVVQTKDRLLEYEKK